MILDIGKLTLFVRVAESGSLTKAATLLGSSPPAISRRIGALEDQCGGLLFHRTGRGLALTELGLRLLPRAQRLLMEAADIEQEIGNAAGVPTGVVHLGMLQAAADPLLTLLLRRLGQEHPGIQLRVTEGGSTQLEQWLSLGSLDVAFLVRERSVLSPSDRALSLNPLHLLMRPDDPMATRSEIEFCELSGLPLILPGLPNGMRHSLQQAARRLNIELNVALEIDSLALQKQLVRGGLGYSIGSRGFVAANDPLKSIKIINPVLERAMILSSTTQRPLTLAARTVLSLATQIAGELSGRGIWQGAASAPSLD